MQAGLVMRIVLTILTEPTGRRNRQDFRIIPADIVFPVQKPGQNAGLLSGFQEQGFIYIEDIAVSD
mgnify:CR=1 FL=1